MNKMMIAALCGVVCMVQSVSADDFGIVSASPVTISDPVNPQPGMVLKAYKLESLGLQRAIVARLKESVAKFPSLPAAKTVVDKSEDFTLKQFGRSEVNAGFWSGFLKCKRAGVYTLNLKQDASIIYGGGYSLRINGKPVVAAGENLTSVDVNLKVGWNKFELVGMFFRRYALTISYKPKDSLSEPRALSPSMLFFDKKIEEEW